MRSRSANETRKPLKVGARIRPPFIKHCFAHWPEISPGPGFDFLFINEFLEHLGYFVLETKVYQTTQALIQAVESGAVDLSAYLVRRDSAVPNMFGVSPVRGL